ncbi:MAG: hypothetical protein R3279_09700, partial [Putridiphycobacter sp.]|nr:hypothetical protein [Putridiphycobacter sp.]
STADIFDLNAGTYQLEVMDANGCAFVEVFSVSSALGFDNTEVQTTLKYFPEAGTIQITGALESNYKLVDVSGKTIQEYTVEPGLETAELYISKALPSGTYILTGITKSFKLNI